MKAPGFLYATVVPITVLVVLVFIAADYNPAGGLRDFILECCERMGGG